MEQCWNTSDKRQYSQDIQMCRKKCQRIVFLHIKFYHSWFGQACSTDLYYKIVYPDKIVLWDPLPDAVFFHFADQGVPGYAQQL